MGLIAHYRLEDLTASIGNDLLYLNDSGKLTPAAGKLGQAFQRLAYGDGNDYLRSVDKIHLTGSFSMSCWAFVTDAGSSANGLVTNHSHGHNTGAGITVKRIAADDYRISCNTGTGTGRTYYSYYGTSNIKDRWVRLSLRYYAPTQNLSLWVGENKERELTYPMATQEDYLCLFAWSTTYLSSSGYRPGAIIDDVRVYDHAISPREIRDLSLGLSAHYKFDGDFFDSVRYSVAAPVGDVTFDQGVSGKCAVFSSTGKRIGIEPVSSESATLSFWYKRDDAIAARSWRTAFGCAANIHHAIFRNGYIFGIFDGSFKSSGVSVPEDGSFHHCAITLPGDGTAEFFYDGESVGSISTTLSLVANPITRIGDWNGSYWIGYMDDPRIYATALTPAQVKELYQQRASIDSEGSVHAPAIQQNPRARYIRDWINGSTSNGGNHWVEVRAIYAGENISLGKPVTASVSVGRLSKVTDGTTSNSGYASLSATLSATGPAWVQVDLGEVREIDEVQVWHYYADGRTYYGTKTEISEDGINWTTIFDSAVSGTYPETSTGVTHQAKAPGPVGATPQGLRLPEASEVGVARGLVAWYPLLGDTLDYAGTNHAVNNGAVATAEGYVFNGGEWIDLPDDLGYELEVSAFAVFKAKGGPTGGWHIVFGGDRLEVSINASDYLKTGVYAPSRTTSTHGGGLLDGEPHVVGFTLGGGVKTTYIDGVPVGTQAITGDIISSFSYRRLGRFGSDTRYYLNGIIRDVRIHNVALTPEEVAIQAKLALMGSTGTSMTPHCMYTNSQFKEVIC